MTEETSPKNLRKFLESDDPALIRMGLSMAKGSGVPEELLPTILRLYMWDDDKTVRAAARTIFFKCAPAEMQAKVKENWKPSYRTTSIKLKKNQEKDRKSRGYWNMNDKFQEIICRLLKLFTSQDDLAKVVLYPLIKSINDPEPASFEERELQRAAVARLGWTGNTRAIKPLIKALALEQVQQSAIFALANIEDPSVVDPLINLLEEEIKKTGPDGPRRDEDALDPKKDYWALDCVTALLSPRYPSPSAAPLYILVR